MSGLQITVEVDGGEDPTERVLAMEQIARRYCEDAGLDPAEAIMMLLSAAARIHIARAKNPGRAPEALAHALTHAITAVSSIKGLRDIAAAEKSFKEE